jgi:hypothetical protein
VPYLSTSPREIFKTANKAVQKETPWIEVPIRLYLEDNMAFADSIKGFPIVKVIPLKVYEAEKKRAEKATFAAMVEDVLVSVKDIESIWISDHNAPELKDKFGKLHNQLESLKKRCEGANNDM